jgi:hypothetical protein
MQILRGKFTEDATRRRNLQSEEKNFGPVYFGPVSSKRG